MKSFITSTLIIVLIISSASFAIANSDSHPWATFISIQAGGKELDSKWPDPYLDIECVSLTFPYNLYNMENEHQSFLSMVIDLLRTKETDGEPVDTFTSNEIHLGVRQTKNFGRLNMYWNGGLAWVRADAVTTAPATTIKGEDSGLGYWVGIGFNYLMPSRGDFSMPPRGDEFLSMGINAKYADVELSDFGVNGGGLYYGFSLGFVFR